MEEQTGNFKAAIHAGDLETPGAEGEGIEIGMFS